MHATSTHLLADQRTAAKAALAAIIFAAGVAIGAVAGTAVNSDSRPAPANSVQSAPHDTPAEQGKRHVGMGGP